MHVLSPPRLHILETIKRHEQRTIDQLVEMLGHSKTAMRAHLLMLEQLGLIERATPPSDRPGRPPLAFQVTAQGNTIFPSNTSALLTRLLHFLNDHGHTDAIQAFFEEIWRERKTEYLRDLADSPDDTLHTRLTALETVLTRSHFMPRIDTHSHQSMTRITIQECNCPLPAAVRATRIPCQLESAFLAEVIGAPPVQVQFATTPHETCTFAFDLQSKTKASE